MSTYNPAENLWTKSIDLAHLSLENRSKSSNLHTIVNMADTIAVSYVQVIAVFGLLALFSASYLVLIRPTSTKMLTILVLASISAAILSPVLCEAPTNPELSRSLKDALTQVDFVNQLNEEKDVVYDFSKVVADPLHPGSVLNANAATFPMLQGSGMTIAQINLAPCAMLAPHLHPRGHNIVVAVSGNTKTFMRTENGAHDITTTLTAGKATMFYKGSVHRMYNEGKPTP